MLHLQYVKIPPAFSDLFSSNKEKEHLDRVQDPNCTPGINLARLMHFVILQKYGERCFEKNVFSSLVEENNKDYEQIAYFESFISRMNRMYMDHFFVDNIGYYNVVFHDACIRILTTAQGKSRAVEFMSLIKNEDEQKERRMKMIDYIENQRENERDDGRGGMLSVVPPADYQPECVAWRMIELYSSRRGDIGGERCMHLPTAEELLNKYKEGKMKFSHLMTRGYLYAIPNELWRFPSNGLCSCYFDTEQKKWIVSPISEFPTHVYSDVVYKCTEDVSCKTAYFEFQTGNNGVSQVGWMGAHIKEFDTPNGVGDAASSWAYDFSRNCMWIEGKQTGCPDLSEKYYAVGANATVGCLLIITRSEMQMVFTMDGVEQYNITIPVSAVGTGVRFGFSTQTTVYLKTEQFEYEGKREPNTRTVSNRPTKPPVQAPSFPPATAAGVACFGVGMR